MDIAFLSSSDVNKLDNSSDNKISSNFSNFVSNKKRFDTKFFHF
ncbi:MAG: hypothetical protein U0457_02045 [Candidatus Sericytochromatia bacterium]